MVNNGIIYDSVFYLVSNLLRIKTPIWIIGAVLWYRGSFEKSSVDLD